MATSSNAGLRGQRDLVASAPPAAMAEPSRDGIIGRNWTSRIRTAEGRPYGDDPYEPMGLLRNSLPHVDRGIHPVAGYPPELADGIAGTA